MTKVQFNPSTLKASYNSATGKVQTIKEPVLECHNCGQYTATFSGVEDCNCEPSSFGNWPSDLNTTFILPYTNTVGSKQFFKYESEGWYIYMVCEVIDEIAYLDINAFYLFDFSAFFAFYRFQTINPSLANNLLTEPNCCTGDQMGDWAVGYNGLVSYNWDDTGCP